MVFRWTFGENDAVARWSSHSYFTMIRCLCSSGSTGCKHCIERNSLFSALSTTLSSMLSLLVLFGIMFGSEICWSFHRGKSTFGSIFANEWIEWMKFHRQFDLLNPSIDISSMLSIQCQMSMHRRNERRKNMVMSLLICCWEQKERIQHNYFCSSIFMPINMASSIVNLVRSTQCFRTILVGIDGICNLEDIIKYISV